MPQCLALNLYPMYIKLRSKLYCFWGITRAIFFKRFLLLFQVPIQASLFADLLPPVPVAVQKRTSQLHYPHSNRKSTLSLS